jgi:hypothetical protein
VRVGVRQTACMLSWLQHWRACQGVTKEPGTQGDTTNQDISTLPQWQAIPFTKSRTYKAHAETALKRVGMSFPSSSKSDIPCGASAIA